MGPTDVGVRFRWLATALLGAIAAGGAIDLALDRPATLWSFHVLFELGLLTLSLAAVAYLWVGWRDAGRTLEETRSELAAPGAERDAWRTRAEKLLLGLGEEIDRQLLGWGLTRRSEIGCPRCPFGRRGSPAVIHPGTHARLVTVTAPEERSRPRTPV